MPSPHVGGSRGASLRNRSPTQLHAGPPRSAVRAARTLMKRFVEATSGNIAIVTTVALPVIALAAVGGVQIAAVANIRAKTQEIADSAALAGAEQLSVSPSGATARAQTWAQGQLNKLLRDTSTTAQVTATAVDATHIQIGIQTSTPSYFGASLPAGGFQTAVSSTAESVAQWPLCFLATAPSWLSTPQISLSGSSAITSNCQIYSDGNMYVSSGSRVTAASAQVVGVITGSASNIGPAAPLTGAQPIADPFTPMQYLGPQGAGTNPAPCAQTGTYAVTGTATLAPGRYCGNVTVAANAVVTLGSGEYEFDGALKVANGAVVTGDDVLFFFTPGSSMNLVSGSSISLGGRRTGPHAGFVITTTHTQADVANYPVFVIQSDPLAKITGTLYSPVEPLEFDGGSLAGQGSDWTVIVASAVALKPGGGAGSPTLQLNSNYATSAVPVPSGVGSTVPATRLVN